MPETKSTQVRVKSMSTGPFSLPTRPDQTVRPQAKYSPDLTNLWWRQKLNFQNTIT